MTNLHRVRDSGRVALKIGRRRAAFLAGLDKSFRLLADWPSCRNPLVLAVVPVSRRVFVAGPVRKDRGAPCGRRLGRVLR
jgi:hypothetical protein